MKRSVLCVPELTGKRNPAVEQQAIDRIHRLGQKRPVRAVRLFIRDSVEEKLDKIKSQTDKLADRWLQ